ncbi:MAG: hypothetical protein QXU26_03575 [Thermofilaceae archaeon]
MFSGGGLQAFHQVLQQVFGQAVGQAMSLVESQLGRLCQGNSPVCETLRFVFAMIRPQLAGQIQGLLPDLRQAVQAAEGRIEEENRQRTQSLGERVRGEPGPSVDLYGRRPMSVAPATLQLSALREARVGTEAAVQASHAVTSTVKKRYEEYLRQIQTDQLPDVYNQEISSLVSEVENRARAIEGADNELTAWQNQGRLMEAWANLQRKGIETQMNISERQRATMVWLAQQEADLREAQMHLLGEILGSIREGNLERPAAAAGIDAIGIFHPSLRRGQGP